jgi:hypothetical protein
MTWALALVFTAGLQFYIARVRVSLAELPSAVQVNLRCRPAVSARSCRPCPLPSPAPPPHARAPSWQANLFCDRTCQMLFGGLSCSIVYMAAANLLEWRPDYIELWTLIGCHCLVAPRPAAARGTSSWGLGLECSERACAGSGREGGRGRRERGRRERETRSSGMLVTGCSAAGLLGFMSTSAFGESYLGLRLAVFGLYEAAALVALQAASEHDAPVGPHDTSLPGLVSLEPCLCGACCR